MKCHRRLLLHGTCFFSQGSASAAEHCCNATIALTTLVKAQFGTLITFPIFLYIHSILYIYSLKNFVRNPKNLFFVTPTSHLFSNHDNNQHWILRRVRLQTTLGQAFKNTGHHVQSILREQNTNYHLRSWTNWLLWSNSNNCCWGSNYSPLKTWWCRSYKRRVNTRFVGVRS